MRDKAANLHVDMVRTCLVLFVSRNKCRFHFLPTRLITLFRYFIHTSVDIDTKSASCVLPQVQVCK